MLWSVSNWADNPVITTTLALLDEARPIIEHNLRGLTDDEYLWEPVSGCWSVRPRGEIRSPGCWGRGHWVVEVSPDGTVEPTMTTIAWRLMHAYDCATDFASRATGGTGHDWNDIEIAASAEGAVRMMLSGLDDVATALHQATDDVLAGDPDPFFHRPRWELLMKAIHEPVHHCAEIGVLRARWRASSE
jgi:hypothetical protein